MATSECKAVDFFCNILRNNDLNSTYYKNLHEYLRRASREVKSFISKNYCGDQIRSFFEEHDEFFVSYDGNVSVSEEVEDAAVEFFEELFETNALGVVHYTDLDSYIEDDNFITEYMYEFYPDDDILNFFEENHETFSSANGYITLLSERDLASEEQEAVDYFSEVVEDNSGHFHYQDLLNYAEEDSETIMDFINDCYPEDDFLEFVKKYDDLFFVDYDGFVFFKDHVDEETADYFRNVFVEKVYGPIHCSSLYGHIGQAPAHIIKYVNQYYGKKEFWRLLKMNNVIFRMSHDGNVSYVGDEAVKYFVDILEQYYDSPHYLKFRGHVGQAPEDVVNFINLKYPGEKFYDFLTENDVFTVTDGYVSLS